MNPDAQATIATYDKIAKIYAERTFQCLPQFQLNEFVSFLPSNATILDAGCGPGRDAAYFTDFGFQVTGIDASAEMIEEAKRRVTNVTFTRMPLESLTFTEQSFDGIWAMASLLHIPRSAAPDALKGFHRVLKPSGILFLGMKTGKEEGIVRTPEYLEEPRWFVYYTLPDLLALLAAAGFTVLRADPEDDDGYLQIFAQKAPPGAAAPPAP